MYSAIAKNKLNTVIIIVLFLVIIGALGALTAWLTGEWWIAVMTLVIAAVYALIQYFAATSETLALTGAVQIGRADNPRLYRTVENLAIAEGMPMPKVYVISDPAPNAFATGRDPEHAVVAATTGLLEIMDDQELEGVMAHELGHVKNYDIRVSLIVFGLVVAVGLIADIALRVTIFGGRGRGSNNGGPAAIVFLVIGLVAAIIAPLLAAVVQAAVSRQREYLADATGALTTRYPEGLARALEKLKAYGRPVRRTNTSMSHLWISDPNKPGFMQRLFATHPPLDDRIARLRQSADRF
ncbi:M48 family metallopeptidase [Homoserinibacter sp. GY 40078]|uniref:M48 family metallopeptidase n=1 Tax=Homoserinibacter sp. GY 40078 TaxID=2603275 RepID=UPI0011CAACD3|nr:M48 family metallopeptidase [Homoserinibacter sp. GY 40078]TXK19547.1 M48 family metallopeptidase [Homoserinibacter sp. GY 40078]